MTILYNGHIIILSKRDQKPNGKGGIKMDKVTYKLEADMHIAPLEVEYLECDYEIAVRHFKSWLKDPVVFNEMFYKVTYNNDVKVNEQYIKITA